MTQSRPQPLPTCRSCEYVDWLLDQTAVRVWAIRKLAARLHGDHILHRRVPWTECLHSDCRLAQAAIAGKVDRTMRPDDPPTEEPQ